MADSGLYDSNSDLSSILDDGSSDEESLDGAEGPADSDPEPREHTNREDEQTRRVSQATKAIEAAEERTSASLPDNVVASTSQHPYTSTSRGTAWAEDVPILDAGPAPPDYFAATAWRRSSPANTLGMQPGVLLTQQDQRDLESALPRQQAQQHPATQHRELEATLSHTHVSQTDPTNGNVNVNSQESHGADPLDETLLDETVPLLSRFYVNANGSKRKKNRALHPCTFRRWCVFYIVLVAAVILVVTLTAWFQGHKTSEISRHPRSHGDPALDHPKTALCNFDSYSNDVEIAFEDPDTFTLVDVIEFSKEPELKDTLVTGNVEVMYVPRNSSVVQYSPIVVRMRMATVRPWKVEMVANSTYSKSKDELILKRPNLQRATMASAVVHPVASRPCLDVFILIHVREGTVLKRWTTELQCLNFIDHDGAIRTSTGPSAKLVQGKPKLFVADRTRMYTQSGDIDISYWSSNDTQLETWDGSISGTYQLHSNMELSSDRGNIDVRIDSVLDDNDAIASDLITRRGHSWYRRTLGTSSASGQTIVRVQPPSTRHNSPSLPNGTFAERNIAHTPIHSDDHNIIGNGFWGDLFSFHYSRSGSMFLNYPSEWSGNIIGWSVDGNIFISGDGVEIISDEEERGLKTVTAHKGVNERLLLVNSLGGQAFLHIGG